MALPFFSTILFKGQCMKLTCIKYLDIIKGRKIIFPQMQKITFFRGVGKFWGVKIVKIWGNEKKCSCNTHIDKHILLIDRIKIKSYINMLLTSSNQGKVIEGRLDCIHLSWCLRGNNCSVFLPDLTSSVLFFILLKSDKMLSFNRFYQQINLKQWLQGLKV